MPNGTEPVDGTKYDLRDDPVLDGRSRSTTPGRTWSMPTTAPTTAVFTRPDGMKVTVGGDETDHLLPGVHRHRLPRRKASGRHRRGTAHRLRKRVQHRQRPHHHQARREPAPPLFLGSGLADNNHHRPLTCRSATHRTAEFDTAQRLSLVCDNPEGLFLLRKGVQSWACVDVSARIVVRRPPTTASARTPDP